MSSMVTSPSADRPRYASLLTRPLPNDRPVQERLRDMRGLVRHPLVRPEAAGDALGVGRGAFLGIVPLGTSSRRACRFRGSPRSRTSLIVFDQSPSTPPACFAANLAHVSTAAAGAPGSVKRANIPERFGALPSPLITWESSASDSAKLRFWRRMLSKFD